MKIGAKRKKKRRSLDAVIRCSHVTRRPLVVFVFFGIVVGTEPHQLHNRRYVVRRGRPMKWCMTVVVARVDLCTKAYKLSYRGYVITPCRKMERPLASG